MLCVIDFSCDNNYPSRLSDRGQRKANRLNKI